MSCKRYVVSHRTIWACRAQAITGPRHLDSPLLQVLDEVSPRALRREGRDAEEADFLIAGLIAGSAVARDAVADDLAAGAGGNELRGVGEVADEGDLGQWPGWGRAEGAPDAGLGADAGDCRAEHFGYGWQCE